jgi:hypothetical protein
MSKPLINSAVVVFCAVAVAAGAVLQTPTSSGSVEAQVTVSKYNTDGTLKAESFSASFTPNPIGKFSLGDRNPLSVREDCKAARSQMGTKVDGTVTPTSAGSFQLHLFISVRAAGGCRQVGDANVPIFVNTAITKDAVVASGEKLSVPVGSRSGSETLKVEVTLTKRK